MTQSPYEQFAEELKNLLPPEERYKIALSDKSDLPNYSKDLEGYKFLDLDTVNLSGIQLPSNSGEKPIIISTRNCDLTGAVLGEGSNVMLNTIIKTNMTHVDARGVDLSKTNFRASDVEGMVINKDTNIQPTQYPLTKSGNAHNVQRVLFEDSTGKRLSFLDLFVVYEHFDSKLDVVANVLENNWPDADLKFMSSLGDYFRECKQRNASQDITPEARDDIIFHFVDNFIGRNPGKEIQPDDLKHILSSPPVDGHEVNLIKTAQRAQGILDKAKPLDRSKLYDMVTQAGKEGGKLHLAYKNLKGIDLKNITFSNLIVATNCNLDQADLRDGDFSSMLDDTSSYKGAVFNANTDMGPDGFSLFGSDIRDMLFETSTEKRFTVLQIVQMHDDMEARGQSFQTLADTCTDEVAKKDFMAAENIVNAFYRTHRKEKEEMLVDEFIGSVNLQPEQAEELKSAIRKTKLPAQEQRPENYIEATPGKSAKMIHEGLTAITNEPKGRGPK